MGRVNSSKKPLVSVVIPAYHAEKIIQKSLLRINDVLSETRYRYEIICVVDGTVDKTLDKAKRVAKKFSRKIRVLGYKDNKGKGHAVRYGMAHARGEIIGFIDAGMDVDPNGISMLLEHFQWYKADIMIGSKRHPASKVIYPWQRRVLSFGYQVFVKVLFGLNVRDTQVGLKFFRVQVIDKILPRLLVKAWAFDVEMLAVANSLGYNRIYEAPVKLKIEFGGTSVLTSKKFTRTIIGFILDTLAVFYRLNIVHYYDYTNRKNWVKHKYLTFTKNENKRK